MFIVTRFLLTFSFWILAGFRSCSCEVNTPCMLQVNQNPGLVQDVKITVVNKDALQYDGVWNGGKAWVRVNLENPEQARYNSIIPTVCSASATASDGAHTSVSFVENRAIRTATRLAVFNESGYKTRDGDEKSPIDYHIGIDLSTLAFRGKNTTVTIQCQVRTCIQFASDMIWCEASAENFGSASFPGTRKRNVQFRKTRSTQLTREVENENEIEPEGVCVTEAIFIALTTGMGLLVIMLISLNGILIYKSQRGTKGSDRFPPRQSVAQNIPLASSRIIPRANPNPRSAGPPSNLPGLSRRQQDTQRQNFLY